NICIIELFLVENHITKLIYLIDTLAVCYTAYIDLKEFNLMQHLLKKDIKISIIFAIVFFLVNNSTW
ncbi:hypothetical protein RJB76_03925, partial [Staphylococcus hominis]|nr:hypothetical protein [Staphylococcus hominis]